MNINLDPIESQDLTGAFKITNLIVAGLSFLSALYIIAFGVVIGLLEFNVPAEAYAYGSFLFSFIGRGVFYTLIAVSLNGGSVFRLIAAMLLFIIGLVYIALETIPSISPPDNMNAEGSLLGLNDEEVV
ncbi:uncharacterized protein J8A68_004765 [[Candida] subhashii]|uniref:COPI associated protein n=1 Tax=[Candida] subhashii TaxID=561895 RepID=A0A8J5QEX9_9ASCO|nr:uncharacterized protein J8A68_004765 [[Candida] subhashii]KAG7661707.1 hypothetical protein J8A68_004765 [[Candida] subhashii]